MCVGNFGVVGCTVQCCRSVPETRKALAAPPPRGPHFLFTVIIIEKCNFKLMLYEPMKYAVCVMERRVCLSSPFAEDVNV